MPWSLDLNKFGNFWVDTTFSNRFRSARKVPMCILNLGVENYRNFGFESEYSILAPTVVFRDIKEIIPLPLSHWQDFNDSISGL